MQHCQVPKFPDRKQVFRGHRLSQPMGGKVDSRMERPKKGHMEVLKNPRESRWGERVPEDTWREARYRAWLSGPFGGPFRDLLGSERSRGLDCL